MIQFFLKALIDTYFLWLPVILAIIFWTLWIYYIRSKFISNLKWVLLEIKLPREIMKSPKAMEIIFNAMHITRDGNLIEKYIDGFLRAWFSLEIVGINGEIHFFIYTQKFFRNLIESQIYAQYPDIEITETDDYTDIYKNQEFFQEWNSFGFETALTAEDAYPIKTYVDYGLHETATKEEQKTDPITSFLESLGFLNDGEQIWMQILIRGTKKDWGDEGKKLIDKIIGVEKVLGTEDKMTAIGALHPGQTESIKAIERSISKLGFDACVRLMYLAKKDIYNPVNIAAMLGSIKQYNSMNLNGFKPVNSTSVDYFFVKRREALKKIIMFNAYNKRSCFYMPYERKSFILNSEELATIYHFPGRTAETPTFKRIEAKKSEPPTTLPI